jgi:hypothetical protein
MPGTAGCRRDGGVGGRDADEGEEQDKDQDGFHGRSVQLTNEQYR